MKIVMKILLTGLFLVSVNVSAATVDGSLIIGGAYNATGGTDLSDATTIDLSTVFANGGTGDVDGTVNVFTPPGTGGSASLASFAAVPGFFTVGGWTLDLSTLSIVDQTVGVLNLSGTGVLSGNGFDATNVDWSFSSQSETSYSMTVTSVGVVPLPAAVWLFGSGLLGLVGIARRKA